MVLNIGEYRRNLAKLADSPRRIEVATLSKHKSLWSGDRPHGFFVHSRQRDLHNPDAQNDPGIASQTPSIETQLTALVHMKKCSAYAAP